MQNLAQLRARNSFEALDTFKELKTKDGRAKLSGFGAFIRNNGLLAAVAFALAKGDEHLAVANAIAFHLANFRGRDLIALEPVPQGMGGLPRGAARLVRSLSAEDTDVLRLMKCTEEALAFLNYLKRFAFPAAQPVQPAQGGDQQ